MESPRRHDLAIASISALVAGIALAFGSWRAFYDDPRPMRARPPETRHEAEAAPNEVPTERPFAGGSAILRGVDTSGDAVRLVLEVDDGVRVCAIPSGALAAHCAEVAVDVTGDQATLVAADASGDLEQTMFRVRDDDPRLVDRLGRTRVVGDAVDARIDRDGAVRVIEVGRDGYTWRRIVDGVSGPPTFLAPHAPGRTPHWVGARALYVSDGEDGGVVHLAEDDAAVATVGAVPARAFGVRSSELDDTRVVAIEGEPSHGIRPLHLFFFFGDRYGGTTSLTIPIRDYVLTCGPTSAIVTWVGGLERERPNGILVSRADCELPSCTVGAADVPVHGDDPIAMPVGDQMLLAVGRDDGVALYFGLPNELHEHPLDVPAEVAALGAPLARSGVVHRGAGYLFLRGRDRFEVLRISPEGAVSRLGSDLHDLAR